MIRQILWGELMKVRILVQCVTTLNAYSVGDIVEVPDLDATSMVSAGLAEPLNQNPPASSHPVPELPESRRKRRTEERA